MVVLVAFNVLGEPCDGRVFDELADGRDEVVAGLLWGWMVARLEEFESGITVAGKGDGSLLDGVKFYNIANGHHNTNYSGEFASVGVPVFEGAWNDVDT